MNVIVDRTEKRAPTRARAFTLIELLVVLAVLALLATTLLRALAGITEGALRTQCLYNLRQLGIGSTVYANDNKELLVPAKPANNPFTSPYQPPFVQISIGSIYTNALNGAGIPLVSNAPSVWCCPDIPDLPYPDNENYSQWDIGYQYFGGITGWTPAGQAGLISGTHSPVKLTQSQPYWCLAADLVARINNTWGGTNSQVTSVTPAAVEASMITWPPHREGTNAIPAGGNEVFMDGSANWCRVETMHNFTSWTSANEMWFYQRENDLNFGARVEYSSAPYKWTGN